MVEALHVPYQLVHTRSTLFPCPLLNYIPYLPKVRYNPAMRPTTVEQRRQLRSTNGEAVRSASSRAESRCRCSTATAAASQVAALTLAASARRDEKCVYTEKSKIGWHIGCSSQAVAEALLLLTVYSPFATQPPSGVRLRRLFSPTHLCFSPRCCASPSASFRTHSHLSPPLRWAAFPEREERKDCYHIYIGVHSSNFRQTSHDPSLH